MSTTTKAKKTTTSPKTTTERPKPLNKSQLIKALSEHSGVSKTDVERVLISLQATARAQLYGVGEVKIPDLVKLKAVVKPAAEACEKVNPFTKEMMKVAARPASTKVRLTALKWLKDAVANS